MLFLPQEVICLILEQLDPEQDKSTVLALRSVCRLFNRLARPLVYVTLRDFETSEEAVEDGPQPTTWDVINDPSLASLVKCLRLRPIDGDCAPYQYVREQSQLSYPTSSDQVCVETGSNEDVLYRQVLRATSLPAKLQDELFDELYLKGYQAHALLVLAMCPQLEVLDLTTGLDYDTVLGNLLRFAVKSLSTRSAVGLANDRMCASLTRVHIGHRTYVTSLADAFVLLRLPQLESLRITSLADYYETDPPRLPSSSKPGEACITWKPLDLILDVCRLSAQGLEALLVACPGPCSLSIRWNTHGVGELLEQDVGNVLRASGTNLVSLTLDTTELKHDPQIVTGAYCFGPLVALTSLRKLAIPVTALMEPSTDEYGPPRYRPCAKKIPPACIEDLTLLGVSRHAREDNDWEELAMTVDFPQLRRVVTVPWTWRDEHGERAARGARAAQIATLIWRESLECVDYDDLVELEGDNVVFCNIIDLRMW